MHRGHGWSGGRFRRRHAFGITRRRADRGSAHPWRRRGGRLALGSDEYQWRQTPLSMLASCRGIRLPANSKTMIKSLDTKIADIRANPSGSKAFIIADAKDADMAFGIGAPGPRRNSKINEYDSSWKSLEDYSAQIRDVVSQCIANSK